MTPLGLQVNEISMAELHLAKTFDSGNNPQPARRLEIPGISVSAPVEVTADLRL